MNSLLRLATIHDIPAALQLCRLSGWNQLTEDWQRLLEYEPDGCFVAEANGKVVGTVTTTRYGTDLAWIGMMLVHPDYRRRGIATLLMNRSLDYLHGRKVRCIKLDATPDGRHVYERLGFSAEWSMRRWMRNGTGQLSTQPKESRSHRPEASSLQPYFDLDRRGFGVDRRQWILRLLPDSEIQCHPQAFGMLRRGFLASYLGPLIASDIRDARPVVQDLIRRTSAPVFWDIPDPNQAAADLASELHFVPVRQLARMWTGTESVESDLDSLFALADPSTG